eukprot:g11643.t1
MQDHAWSQSCSIKYRDGEILDQGRMEVTIKRLLAKGTTDALWVDSLRSSMKRRHGKVPKLHGRWLGHKTQDMDDERAEKSEEWRKPDPNVPEPGPAPAADELLHSLQTVVPVSTTGSRGSRSSNVASEVPTDLTLRSVDAQQIAEAVTTDVALQSMSCCGSTKDLDQTDDGILEDSPSISSRESIVDQEGTGAGLCREDLPPAPWCEFCARGHAMDDPHRRRTVEQKLAENHFELDYSFLKTDTSIAERFEESSDLSIVDSGTGMALAMSIPGKNLETPYVVKTVTSFIAQLGYLQVKLRSDNEPVIKKIVAKIAGALREGKAPGAEGLKVQFEEAPGTHLRALELWEHFRRVGIALYLSYDRTDVQFAVQELTKDMKEPTDGSLRKLHRLARYLQGTKDYGVWLPKDGEIEILKVHSDTDWVNCKKTRKRCACTMFEVGGCLLFSYARSLQSGEAEFNGGVAACSEGLFIALSGFSKQALMAALLTLLQSAEGMKTEEPNAGDGAKWGFDWIFTDLAVAFGILLIMQGTALWWCFKVAGKHLALSGGLRRCTFLSLLVADQPNIFDISKKDAGDGKAPLELAAEQLHAQAFKVLFESMMHAIHVNKNKEGLPLKEL